MSDDPPESPAPRPTSRDAPVDQGLASWGGILRDALSAQSGVEIIGAGGGTVGFKFRGQTFSVTIVRVG
jgi:hypothetical protein